MKPSLLQNWHLQLIALGLAVMVWFTIQRATNTEIVTIHNVRVEPRTAEGRRVGQIQPPLVSIKIRGERAGVMAVTSDHFLVRPDLTETSFSDGEVELKMSDVDTPEKIRVLGVLPEKIHVTLEDAPHR